MKCIRKTNKIVERISDEKASELVQAGKAEYVPKHVWKKEVRD